MANYYRSFVRKFGHIAEPLTELTKKDHPFTWQKPQQDAFNALKQALATAPVLALHDPLKDNYIYTDSSAFAYGAVLMQKHATGKLQPIGFLSPRHSPAERNYDTFDQEFGAMRYAAEKWHYLLRNNTKNIFITDHENLKSLCTKNHLSGRNLRWYQQIEENINSFEIKFIAGKLNVVADALSRRPDHVLLNLYVFVSSVGTLLNRFISSYATDPFVAATTKKFLLEPNCPYFFRDELLCYRDSSGPRFYVPAGNDLRELIMSEHHDLGIAGHLGVTKCLRYIRRQYYWPDMKRNVRNYIRSCEHCQRNKPSNTSPAGLLQPLPIPAKRWDSVSMDFITLRAKVLHATLYCTTADLVLVI